jgi:hypothetical protein
MAMNRKRKFIATIALAAGLITYVVVSRTPRHAGSTPADSQSSVITETKASLAAPIHIATRDSSIQPTALIRAATSDSAVTPPNARTPQQLVAEILEISSAEGPITAEKATQFKRNLEELIKRGAVSVPAIRELLDKKIEYDFMDVAGGEQIGYASLRASLIDALKQIGGPDAQEAMVQVLQTSALPSELLEIAKNLDQEAPGIYREQILNAARESLAIAATNQLVANLELGPAFRIIQNYGGDYTTADGANNEPANFNNAVNLANMPDGQGLAALVQMAQTPSSASAQTIATEMIAQMAGENAKAADSLMQLAQNGQISNSTWEKLAPILGGDQFQIANSPAQNQGFTVVNNTTTADQINQRIVLIDQFLGVVPSDSAAAASLRNQRKLLTGKLPR